ncbi:nucleotide sugar dehydrogenase [Flavobacterium psychrophilum]|uniref:UDP-N-acetyl-D-galactosamine dehydrogenase n=2 Tax=Flavobacterium psychrophilum TaxID=96345 RepID=A6GZ56_FLAPJ|nr:nucleotide sugar dehydrogenase [Flavobacterium psychrophilum]AIG30086.1 UDP-N-acetyl-D-galactosamine dehydrogenase [Flavobacterium psychrophilum]AIG32362.1 UDP-N-acetyl-D-galactosamine dehydrogenase [Flavobacterium psychrophilum]AIG34520.1 UDP-N-acetyl-D-galactosamine dehydrogenase [Flavobacterium psychrophilum]AIG36880.1 UDP-N-acetyl-D-galactosamine dehydrogenase [Flavobacterium psychrophilum]AIG39144.1 UDP-N-acetyl-D-galactosamine dehydrogenase [Flavobacterium psychrophilum]
MKIAVIGLGYVGLPLARLFATKYDVVGFDINTKRVSELHSGLDSTLEVSQELLQSVLKTENTNTEGLFCSTNIDDIKDCNHYIVTVPTPVDKNNKPDLTPLYKSSETVGQVLKKGDIVIYESTVYPGVTEEECVPVLEKTSGLKFNIDFFAGYSPERINPGDKEHTVDKILKVTSGSTPEIGEKVNELYKSVITAGTHLAPTIRVAEAAKVIENSQRDINIAFVNELAKIFNVLGIDTQDVLAAAGTKWNFLPFKPGLVGGHCIGVDPYYLAQKAQQMGYHPEIILAGRRLNDSMGEYVASQVVKLMSKREIGVNNAELLMLGIAFKENCPDVRNTKIVDVISALKEYGIHVTIYDPWVNPADVLHEYNLQTAKELPSIKFDAVVLGVAHQEFLSLDFKSLQKEKSILYDVKGILGNHVDGKL